MSDHDCDITTPHDDHETTTGRCPGRGPDESSAVDFIRALVGAWDCCGTCAGGVLARHDRDLIERAEVAEAAVERVRGLAAEWAAEDHPTSTIIAGELLTALDGVQDARDSDLTASEPPSVDLRDADTRWDADDR